MALLALPPCPDGAVARSQPLSEPPIQREVYTLTTWSAQPADGDGEANGADGALARAHAQVHLAPRLTREIQVRTSLK